MPRTGLTRRTLTPLPNSAIDEAQNYATIPAECIFCCACIKVCPEQAREMAEGPFMEKTLWLKENCSRRKEPELFFAEN